MPMTRRDFVKGASLAPAFAARVRKFGRAGGALPAIAFAQAPGPVQTKEPINPLAVRVGMTDWNLGQRGDITKIALAREIGLDGIQVSLQFPTDGKTPTLRDPQTQAAFRRAALDNGIQICSLAIGSPGKSRLPLHTNPAAAILLVEAVEVARNLGTNNILLPILGDSHIDMTNQVQVDTFVAMMKEVARYAEKYDVVVAVEDWISAEDNIRLLDAIGSDYVAVYYDAHNIVGRAKNVRDIYAEPKLLGKRIHQIHVKNADMLLSSEGGKLDWPRMAQAFYEIGYRGWYVLETASPTKDIVADTRANLAYVKQTFRMPPPLASRER
jgi:L-ribulose-5-phosphate 3-epimerase